MRRLMFARSLQPRLLAVLVITVSVALGTVALVVRASTTAEFTRYVATNRQEMQAVAGQIAATTGERLLVTGPQGRVILDSSGELVGQQVSPETLANLGAVDVPRVPPLAPLRDQSRLDVLFVRRGAGAVDDGAVWTRDLKRGEPLLLPPPVGLEDPEQRFLSAVTRALLIGVGVGGVVAVVLALAFARGILRPVGALTEAARRMERGDLSQRVEVRSRDEIGQLAHAFNAMADGLARTEQLRRSMVTDVAHELRTPLTNLRGYLEALRDGVTEPRPAVINSLYDEALLLSQLVDDLQDLALSEAGRLTLHREAIDVATLLRCAAQAFAPRASEQCIQLRVCAEEALVDADSQRIGQVLRNLLSNALTHTAAGGQVVLRAVAKAEALYIEVEDSGCGIPPEHLENVFERFYRVDGSRARATGGAGIGLAVVKQLVQAHGGGVSVTSTEGEGSCFGFSLPYAREPRQAPKALSRPLSASRSDG